MQVTHELTSSQIDDLVALYQTAWWSVGRVRPDVEVMLRGCLPFAFLDADRKVVAFARAITDGVYKALVCDVIVSEPYRGTGLGQRLIDTVLEHPTVARCGHVELYCLPPLIPFYSGGASPRSSARSRSCAGRDSYSPGARSGKTGSPWISSL